MHIPRPTVLALALLLVTTAACGPTVDVKAALKVQIGTTGWADAGMVDGKNKIVPAAQLTVRNIADQKLPVVQLNALFHRVNEKEEWGSALVSVAGSEGLASGATSKVLTAKAQLGYTGLEPRPDMLKNSQFVDATVQIFAKYGSQQWVLVGEYPITRQLLTP